MCKFDHQSFFRFIQDCILQGLRRGRLKRSIWSRWRTNQRQEHVARAGNRGKFTFYLQLFEKENQIFNIL